MVELNKPLRALISILKYKRTMGYYRTLFYRGFPRTLIARILLIYFVTLRRFLSNVVLPLGISKRIIIPSNRRVEDFEEALTYVYFGPMYELVGMQLPKDGVCVDVGAHYGFWTLKMSSKCKLIIALKPAPSNFAILYNSLIASKIKNVIPFRLAAGDSTSKAFIIKRKGATDEMYAISMSTIDAQEKHTVKIVSLDDLLDGLSIQRVDIMKIDVEGFELNVLKGLKRRISRKLINVIVLEVHSPLLLHDILKMLSDNYDVKAFRTSRGLYEVYAISKSNEYGQL
jgi:FkbM family methyltransferase